MLEQIGATRWTPEQAVRDEAMFRLGELMGANELTEAIRRGHDLSPEAAARLALAALS
jgi:hypothetical protein